MNEHEQREVTGVGYGVRHTVSGRWYRGRGRFTSDAWPHFDGPLEALRSARRYLRETEISFLELVPLRRGKAESGWEAKAAGLLAAEPRPLLTNGRPETSHL